VIRRDPAERSAAPLGVRRSAHLPGPPALPVSFFRRPAEEVAAALLGCHVVTEVDGMRCRAEIVETEAYVGPDDEASHAHRRFGVTDRNRVMYGPPGLAYVYRIYGLHSCLNAVTGEEGYPAAVLIRAARPLEGLDMIRARRAGRAERDLLRGPGNLCRGLGVDLRLNRHPLHEAPLWLTPGTSSAAVEVACGPRVGITRAVDLPLRFWVRGSPWVSR
jgi:DNA-3-methyladenine glycosylase